MAKQLEGQKAPLAWVLEEMLGGLLAVELELRHLQMVIHLEREKGQELEKGMLGGRLETLAEI